MAALSRFLIATSLLAAIALFSQYVLEEADATPFDSVAQQEVGDEKRTNRRRLSSLVDMIWSQYPSTLEESLPILVMGLPRSGSLALHNFFTCNAMSSAHYCCGQEGAEKSRFPCNENGSTCGSCVHANMLAGRAPFDKCGDYQVYSQFDVETGDPFAWFLPQHFTKSLLHKSYPNAVFILNTRGTPEQWADSVLHWYSITNRIFNSYGIQYHSNLPKVSEAPMDPLGGQQLYSELEKSLERAKDPVEHARRRQDLVTIYKTHTAKLKKFVQDHPTHRLIEINVDDPSAGQILASAFSWNADCWSFDAEALDNDWQDFSLKV